MKARTLILENFNIRYEEVKKFTILFASAFFMGLFIAFYFVPANSVFIHHFGIKFLPIAYLISGLTGYLTSAVYAFLQRRLPIARLFLFSLLLMLIPTFLGRVSLGFVNEKYLSLFVFTFAWPFISLVSTIIGGLTIAQLDLLQVKRLYGLINIGGVLAAILGYLTVPLIVPFLYHSYDLLILGMISLMAAMYFIYILFQRFQSVLRKETSGEKSDLSFMKLFSDRYFVYLILVAILSMSSIFIVDFSFLAAVKIQKDFFPTQKDISQFLALVYAGLKIGELIISLFSNRLIARYGVGFGLFALPFYLLGAVAVAILLGFAFGIDSVLFFAIMVLNKAFERILRRGLDEPSFNVLYQPLPNHMKLAIQAQISQVIQLSTAFAGVIILIGTYLVEINGVFRLELFSILFLPLLFVWGFISLKLYNQYKQRIHNLLEEKKLFKIKDSDKDTFGTDVLTRQLYNEDMNAVKLSCVILAETNPRLLEQYIPLLYYYDDKVIHNALLSGIDSTFSPDLLPSIQQLEENTDDPNLKVQAEVIRMILEANITQEEAEQISVDTLSRHYLKAFAMIKFLKDNTLPNEVEILQHLLDIENHKVRRAAIYLAGYKTNTEVVDKLMDLFKMSDYIDVVAETFNKYGDDILPFLEPLVKSKDTEEFILFKVIEVCAKIGSPASLNLLTDMLETDNPELQRKIVQTFQDNEYQVPESSKPLIREIIFKLFRNVYWSLVFRMEFTDDQDTMRMVPIVDKEFHLNVDYLLQLLSLIYNYDTIDLIRTNVKGDNTIYALELIDNFIEPDIKGILTPLIEDLSVSQRVKKLSAFFPSEKMSLPDRLKQIIRANQADVSLVMLSKAIEALGNIYRSHKFNKWTLPDNKNHTDINWNDKEINEVIERIRHTEMPEEIFLGLFHKHELIYSTSAKIIYNENPTRCFTYLNSFYPEKRQLYDLLENKKPNDKGLIHERIKALKRQKLFSTLPENYVVKLATIVRLQDVMLGEKISVFDSVSGMEDVILISKGIISDTSKPDAVNFERNNIVIRGLTISNDCEYLDALENSIIIRINRKAYFSVLINQVEMIENMFKNLN